MGKKRWRISAVWLRRYKGAGSNLESDLRESRAAIFFPYPTGHKSFATTLISKGKEDLKTTAALGNWKDVRILLEHYVDPYGMDEIFERNFEGLLARNWQDQNPHESQVIVTKRKKPKMRTESLPPVGGGVPPLWKVFGGLPVNIYRRSPASSISARPGLPLLKTKSPSVD
jgi:hypothetical protein